MDVAASSSQGPPRWRAGSSRRWLSYFIAALGAGLSPAQEQVLLDYYWIYPESEAQPEQLEYGKGYNSLLRTEATELSHMLQREGMEPKRSYAEAWLAVYRRHWLNFDWQPGSSELDEVLFQMLHTDSRHPMTDAEVRHALEVLFAEADFVSLEQGRELLENLADNLRAHSFPLSESGQKSNDEPTMSSSARRPYSQERLSSVQMVSATPAPRVSKSVMRPSGIFTSSPVRSQWAI